MVMDSSMRVNLFQSQIHSFPECFRKIINIYNIYSLDYGPLSFRTLVLWGATTGSSSRHSSSSGSGRSLRIQLTDPGHGGHDATYADIAVANLRLLLTYILCEQGGECNYRTTLLASDSQLPIQQLRGKVPSQAVKAIKAHQEHNSLCSSTGVQLPYHTLQVMYLGSRKTVNLHPGFFSHPLDIESSVISTSKFGQGTKSFSSGPPSGEKCGP
ncbi:hypothetical protein F2P81_021789 [Scophthalmus maximus]|uniref:Uncharacterized protein n=1 Tax=Scophthalmus maximus TaxID=52904 RepID=A0A6A4RYA9_SCOMX|nr:hypothetical protein F2P81_021789 [Scophthalmus maximus]